MNKFFIPKPYRIGFKNIIMLDDNQLKLICEKLKLFTVGDGPNDLEEILSELEIPEILEIAKTIYSFGFILKDSKLDFHSTASGLLLAYNDDSDDEIDVNDEKFNKNLVTIFENSEKIKLSHKALELFTNVPISIRSCNVITDIRPIFHDNINQGNRFALITQQLQMTYNENSENKTIFINFDKQDLEDLKEQIDRAILKQSVIQADYSNIYSFIEL